MLHIKKRGVNMKKIDIDKLNDMTSLENFFCKPPIMHDIFSGQMDSNIKLLNKFKDYFIKQLNEIEYNTVSNYIKSNTLKDMSFEYNYIANIEKLETQYFNSDLRPDCIVMIKDVNCEEYYTPVINSIDKHNNKLNEYATSREAIINECKNWLAENEKIIKKAEQKINKYDKTAAKSTRAYDRLTNKLINAHNTSLYDTIKNVFVMKTTMELGNMMISHLEDTVDYFKKFKTKLIKKVNTAKKNLETKSEQEKIAELQEIKKCGELNSYERMQLEGL